MTDTTTVYYVDSNGSRAIHTDKSCSHLRRADGEVKSATVYHSRRVGNPSAIQNRGNCQDCWRQDNDD